MYVFMQALTHLVSHYVFVPPSFCLVDLGNSQGTEKVKWLCSLFSSSSSPLSLMCMWEGAGRVGPAASISMKLSHSNEPAKLSRIYIYVCWNWHLFTASVLPLTPPSTPPGCDLHLFLLSLVIVLLINNANSWVGRWEGVAANSAIVCGHVLRAKADIAYSSVP